MSHANNFVSLLAMTGLFLGACQQQEPADETGEMTTPVVDATAEEAAIDATMTRYVEAYPAHDPAVLGAFYTEDAIFLADDEPNAIGRAAIEGLFARRFAEVPDVTIEIEREGAIISSSGDLAVTHGTYTLTGTKDGSAWEDTRQFVITYQKVDGEWKLSGVIWNGAGPDPVEGAEP